MISIKRNRTINQDELECLAEYLIPYKDIKIGTKYDFIIQVDILFRHWKLYHGKFKGLTPCTFTCPHNPKDCPGFVQLAMLEPGKKRYNKIMELCPQEHRVGVFKHNSVETLLLVAKL
jgi:hypothetical protein